MAEAMDRALIQQCVQAGDRTAQYLRDIMLHEGWTNQSRSELAGMITGAAQQHAAQMMAFMLVEVAGVLGHPQVIANMLQGMLACLAQDVQHRLLEAQQQRLATAPEEAPGPEEVTESPPTFTAQDQQCLKQAHDAGARVARYLTEIAQDERWNYEFSPVMLTTAVRHSASLILSFVLDKRTTMSQDQDACARFLRHFAQDLVAETSTFLALNQASRQGDPDAQ